MGPRLLLISVVALAGADAAMAAGPRNLDAHQRDTIRHYVLREAKASILSPHDGEPKQFARVLAEALRASGTWVAVDQNNSVAPGETGVTVIYDHDVPADSSIFLALQRAGLNPKDVNVPGAPVATVIVGPQP